MRASAVTRTNHYKADAAIDALAAAQHGLVTRTQLVLSGISRHAVDNRIRSGRLRRIHAGVYQVGPLPSRHAAGMAAVLACGDVAVSRHTAATLWELAPERTGQPVDIVCAEGHRVRRPGIRAHRCATASAEVTRFEGIPVTTAAMTLLDLSRVLTGRDLERVLARGQRAGLFDHDRLRALLERYPARGAAARLRPFLVGGTPAFTRSDAEERLLALVRAGGLSEPQLNVLVHGYELDCYWPAARLAVEVDGYAFHSSARAFARDRQRDMTLAAAGIQVLRLSWEQVTKDRDRSLVQLAQVLALATRAAAR